MPQTGAEHMGKSGHKMLEKELKSRENRQKRLKSVGSIPGYLRDIAYKFAGETWKHLS